jgi:hypothetical protein
MIAIDISVARVRVRILPTDTVLNVLLFVQYLFFFTVHRHNLQSFVLYSILVQ